MADIISFKGGPANENTAAPVEEAKPESNLRLVALLKELLTDAESGKLQGIALVTYSDTAGGTWARIGTYAAATLGLLHVMAGYMASEIGRKGQEL
jgi:hypothetical protein